MIHALRRFLIADVLVDGVLESTEWALRRRLRWRGADFSPKTPSAAALGWLNSTLKSKEQVAAAVAEARRCGLPPHQDSPKNWDALAAIALILDKTSKQAAVLDAGAPEYSANLHWLYLYEYSKLHAIDLRHGREFKRGPITYSPGDLTKTKFPDGAFDVVTCMSVIEHGVPIDAYFAEMARLIRPGGYLITSTDYWETAIDTAGKTAYGGPVKIFTKSEVQDVVARAEQFGFKPLKEIDYACEEKAVRWENQNLEYTFINFALQHVA